MEKCVRVVVSGKVQGVYFRLFTLEEAERLELTGWVRNLPGGEVETLLGGSQEAVEQMLSWLSHGSPLSRVDSLQVREVENPPPLQGFTIRP